jgi:hypothetical protein
MYYRIKKINVSAYLRLLSAVVLKINQTTSKSK